MPLGFSFDPNLCLGCRVCETACQTAKKLPFSLRKVLSVKKTADRLVRHYFISMACNHCQDPECFRVCRENTCRKRRDGIILHDSGKCTACHRCIRACPFDAPRYDPLSRKVIRCDFCHDRIDRGELPACVEECPTHALTVTDLEEIPQRNQHLLPDNKTFGATRPHLAIKPLRSQSQFLYNGRLDL